MLKAHLRELIEDFTEDYRWYISYSYCDEFQPVIGKSQSFSLLFLAEGSLWKIIGNILSNIGKFEWKIPGWRIWKAVGQVWFRFYGKMPKLLSGSSWRFARWFFVISFTLANNSSENLYIAFIWHLTTEFFKVASLIGFRYGYWKTLHLLARFDEVLNYLFHSKHFDCKISGFLLKRFRKEEITCFQFAWRLAKKWTFIENQTICCKYFNTLQLECQKFAGFYLFCWNHYFFHVRFSTKFCEPTPLDFILLDIYLQLSFFAEVASFCFFEPSKKSTFCSFPKVTSFSFVITTQALYIKRDLLIEIFFELENVVDKEPNFGAFKSVETCQ